MMLHRLGRALPEPIRPLVRGPIVRLRYRGLRGSDALLVSYPKSGSTWLRFLLGHVMVKGEIDFDVVRDVIPPIGRQHKARETLPQRGRLARTHEPLSRMANVGAGRVVYLARDSRDVAASYLRHLQREGRYPSRPDVFLRDFLDGRVDNYGSWDAHVLDALTAAPDGCSERILLVRYEDLRRSTKKTLGHIVDFLGIAADTSALVEAIEANSKDRMRAKESSSSFLSRRGTGEGHFVRSDQDTGWPDLFGDEIRSQLLAAHRPALKALGYEVDGEEAP